MTLSQARINYDLEKVHIKYKPGETYNALDDLDIEFRWTQKQVEEFDRMWGEGCSLHSIAHHFNRTCLETSLLLVDRAEKGYVESRKQGIF
jgi:hypothetical protein